MQLERTNLGITRSDSKHETNEIPQIADVNQQPESVPFTSQASPIPV